jgi:nitrite reductase/ring-hydroxylating ferredoxin subunit
MPSYPFATIDEIPDGGRKLIRVRGREIVIFRVGDKYHAMLNRCPHQGAALCAGRISGFMRSDRPGEFTLEREGEVIVCPWHGWHFDILNGQSWCDPDSILAKSYPVVVEPGSQMVKGPFIVEKFDVAVRPGTGLLDYQVEDQPIEIEPGKDYLVLVL